MNRRNILAFLFYIFVIIVSGCGEKQTQDHSNTLADVDYIKEGFAVSDYIADVHLSTGKFERWEQEVMGDSKWLSVCMGNSDHGFWRLSNKLDRNNNLSSGEKAEYILEEYDANTGDISERMFRAEDLGIEDEIGYFVQVFYSPAGLWLLRWSAYEENEEEMFVQIADRVIITDFDQRTVVVDFFDILTQKGLLSAEPCDLPMIMETVEYYTDEFFNIVVYSMDNGCLYVYDVEKRELFSYSGTDEDIVRIIPEGTGKLILITNAPKSKEYLFYLTDVQKKEFNKLCAVSYSNMDLGVPLYMKGNTLFYTGRDTSDTHTGYDLIKWDVATGERLILLNLTSEGIDSSFMPYVVCNDAEDICLCLHKYEEDEIYDWISILSDEAAFEKDDVVIADLVGEGDILKNCILSTQAVNPNNGYKYITVNSDAEKASILSQIADGSGPDIIYVSRNDMYEYARKNLFAGMKELISSDRYDSLLPGVIDLGTVNEVFYGLPTGIMVETFAISKESELNSHWDLKKAVTLWNSGKLSFVVKSPCTGGYLSSESVAMTVLSGNVTELFNELDENNLQSEDEQLTFLLTKIKEEAGQKQNVPEQYYSWFEQQNQLCLVNAFFISDLIKLCDHAEYENAVCIGLPDKSDEAAYIDSTEGFIVVNKHTKNIDAVKDYLDIFLGKEMKKKAQKGFLSIMSLDCDDYVYEDLNGNLFFMGQNENQINVYTDGSNSFDRCITFLKVCKALPIGDIQVLTILHEEIDGMIENGRSVEEAVEIMHRRIGLYQSETQ